MAYPINPLVPGVGRLWMADSGTILGCIPGGLPNKSNSRKLVMFGKRPGLIKSEEAREYEAKFEDVVWRSLKGLAQLPPDAKLYFHATVWQQDLRRDLDCELLPDLLQKFNVIKNDRQIWRKEYTRKIDRDNPRVEFQIGVWADPEDHAGLFPAT